MKDLNIQQEQHVKYSADSINPICIWVLLNFHRLGEGHWVSPKISAVEWPETCIYIDQHYDHGIIFLIIAYAIF